MFIVIIVIVLLLSVTMKLRFKTAKNVALFLVVCYGLNSFVAAGGMERIYRLVSHKSVELLNSGLQMLLNSFF